MSFSTDSTIVQTNAWNRIKFGSDSETTSLLDDFCLEVMQLCNLGKGESTSLVMQVLNDYFKAQNSSSNEAYDEAIGNVVVINRTLHSLITHTTQPLRIPHMTKRLDVVEEFLHSKLRGMTVLDYGGGGGKDSIFYAKCGADVTYCDFLGELTSYVNRRFELRNLNIDIVDVRDLPEKRFDLVNCLDVIEHVYDVEYVVADIVARLRKDGILVCWPAFTPDWSGDHLEKNEAFKEYFIKMLEHLGVKLLLRRDAIMIFHKVRDEDDSIQIERELIRAKSYKFSRRHGLISGLLGTMMLPIYLLLAAIPFIGSGNRTIILEKGLGRVLDNFCVWRLANHRLTQIKHGRVGKVGKFVQLLHDLLWQESRVYKMRRFFNLIDGDKVSR